MHDNEGQLEDLELEGEPLTSHQPIKKSFTITIIIVLLLVGSGAGAYVYLFKKPVAAPPLAVPTAMPTPLPTPVPTIAPTPIPVADITKPTPEPLPSLDESDDAAHMEIAQNLKLTPLVDLLTPDEVIRKFVRAVFNLSKGKVVQQYRPLSGPNSSFKAQAIGRMVEIPSKQGENGTIQTAVFKNNSNNQQRYNVYAKLAEQLNAQQVARLYRTYYPLLQQAYGELGEGPKDFHTVVVQALNNFLATPQVTKEPSLILTSVQYQFLDPQLEALPNTQKLMLRMGPANRERVLTSLKALKTELANAAP